jgi:hypothetical protein
MNVMLSPLARHPQRLSFGIIYSGKRNVITPPWSNAATKQKAVTLVGGSWVAAVLLFAYAIIAVNHMIGDDGLRWLEAPSLDYVLDAEYARREPPHPGTAGTRLGQSPSASGNLAGLA